MSTEPSMEEILSSIKRIIAEEDEPAAASRPKRAAPRPTPAEADEVLELRETVPAQSEPGDAPAIEEATQRIDTILSDRAAQATRGQLEALSRLVVKPEAPGSDTLEGLVRELLRPMLSDWLDAHLPEIVERIVAREISRITNRG